MEKSPVEIFNDKTLKKCLKYWKKKLFLTDWVIKVGLVEPDEMPEKEFAGINSMNFVSKEAVIKISKF